MGKRRILTAKGPQQGFGTTRLVVSRELQLGSAKLYYREAGLGAPLLLIHGLGASSRWWFRLFPELTSANFRIFAPDLPGHGHTPGTTFTIEESARLLVDFADHLQIDRFFIAGHSMGGAIASHLAANYGGRLRRLVLIDSAGVPGVGSKTIFGRLLQPWSWCPPDFYRTMIGDIIRAGPRNILRGVRHLQHYDLRPTLRHIRGPVLVIWGENDALTPPAHGREIVASLPNSRLCTVPNTRHMPMVRRPDVVARLMIDFYGESFKEEASARERPSGEG